MQLDEALTLSAQHLRAATVTVDEQTTALILSDGEDVVVVSHEIGRPELAADRLAEAGRAMVAYAEQIRRAARSSAAWT